MPRGPAIDRDFGPGDDPMAVLGLTKGARVRRLLETAYDAHSLPGWYSFSLTAHDEHTSPACKLYISPRPEALSDAFPKIARRLVHCEVRSFKVGRGIEGLLRPDKIVAYFDDRAHLEEVAKSLDKALRDCPVQGVPFTAQTGSTGLISAGVDPPAGAMAASWRSWVTQQLAASLIVTPDNQGTDRAAAALANIRQAGADPVRWVPLTANFWKQNPP